MSITVEIVKDETPPQWGVVERIFGSDFMRLRVGKFEDLKELRDKVDIAIKEHEQKDEDGVLSSKEEKKLRDWIEQYEFSCQVCDSGYWLITDKVLAIRSPDTQTRGVRIIVLTCDACGNQMFFSADKIGVR